MRRLLLTLALLALLLAASRPVAAQEAAHYFSETGHTVSGQFFLLRRRADK